MKTLNPNAEPCPGGYSLHAYCRWINDAHSFNEFPHEPSGHVQSRSEAERELRAIGWRFHKDGTASCPKCAGG